VPTSFRWTDEARRTGPRTLGSGSWSAALVEAVEENSGNAEAVGWRQVAQALVEERPEGNG
jgi:hypothetical protein